MLDEQDLNKIEHLFDKKFDSIDKRFDSIDKRFDGMDKRLDGMDKRLDGMDKRLDGMDKRLDGMDNRFNQLEFKMEDGFGTLNRRIDAIESDIKYIKIQLERLGNAETEDVAASYEEIDELKKRVANLENQVRILQTA